MYSCFNCEEELDENNCDEYICSQCRELICEKCWENNGGMCYMCYEAYWRYKEF